MYNSSVRYDSTILKLSNNKATLAFSSGVDSVACCHFLKSALPKFDLTLFHFNHQLRSQNDLMEQKAISFAEKLNLPIIIKKRTDLVGDVNPNIFSESSLRRMRYTAMKDLGYVITCHHLDDAVENYMFNTLNGKGEYLPIPLITSWDEYNFNVIRPFIFNEKSVIKKYAKKNNLMEFVVEDETNNDVSFRRNWLRHSIIPQINERGYNLHTIVQKRYREHIQKYLK